jgi:ABC-type uncharacterized transport system substrate-binding protein
MLHTLKRLAPGIILIAAAAGVLLYSDLEHREGAVPDGTASANGPPRVALFAFASNTLLEEGMRGAVAGLEAEGFSDGAGADFERFNAEGDLPTANNIAKRIVDGGYDLVLTVSTPALQTMAAANQAGKVTHVFGMVTDPFHAGVGINAENPVDHPPWLAGIGTFQPVESTLELIHRIAPHITTIGTAWNPAEACSEACTRKARKTCEELGITLIEAQVENTAAVYEAVSSLTARGAQCIYVGGDNTVETAIDSVVRAASANGAAVVSNTPADVRRGAALCLGANYFEVGRMTGKMAAEILQGRDPATVEIRDVMPRKLAINMKAVNALKKPWKIPGEILDAADILIDEAGVHEKDTVPVEKAASAPAKKWRIRFLDYVQAEHVAGNHAGFFARFRELGMIEGRDYEITMMNAQGDMSVLNTMADAALNAQPDLILLTSTPTLQAVIRKNRTIPVIFSNVSNPIIAGAGESNEKHLPFVTGIFSAHDNEGMIEVLRECLPEARSIGTLFCPSEVNSVYNRDSLEAAAKKAGIRLVSMSSNTSADVPGAALALAESGIDAICQIVDNLHDSSFASITQAARKNRMPLFSFVTGLVREGGAAIGVTRDYYSAGQDQADLAHRVMQGERPADMPFRPIRITRLVVNPGNAARCGLEIPGPIIERADEVFEE